MEEAHWDLPISLDFEEESAPVDSGKRDCERCE